MAIIVETMDMPRGCIHCKFLHGIHKSKDDDGTKKMYVGCKVMDEWGFVGDSGRREDCPLTEVKWRKK